MKNILDHATEWVVTFLFFFFLNPPKFFLNFFFKVVLTKIF